MGNTKPVGVAYSDPDLGAVTLTSLAINGTAVTATAAELNVLHGATIGNAIDRLEKTVKLAVAGAADTGGGLLSWANPEAGSILITAARLDVTTAATAACTASFGSTAVSATTLASNLINGQDVHTAAGVFVSSLVGLKLATGKWVTGSTASGASAGLVGNLYLDYVMV